MNSEQLVIPSVARNLLSLIRFAALSVLGMTVLASVAVAQKQTPPAPGPGVKSRKPPQPMCITGEPSSNEPVPGGNSWPLTHAPEVLLARLRM